MPFAYETLEQMIWTAAWSVALDGLAEEDAISLLRDAYTKVGRKPRAKPKRIRERDALLADDGPAL